MIKIKQVVAFGLAAAMVFGSTMTTFASDEQILGSNPAGALTGTTKTVTGENAVSEYVNMKVLKVKVPTDDAMNRVLDYHCDPLELIAQSERIEVDGRRDGVYFNRYEDDAVAYVSNESDELTIINMSSSGIELDYKVRVDTGGGANAYTGSIATGSVVGEDDVRAFTDGNIYFGVIASNSKELAIGKTALNDTVTQSNIVYSARPFYTLSVSDSAIAKTDAGVYKYAIDEDEYSDEDFPSFSFRFIAGLNKNLPDSTWFKSDESLPLKDAVPYDMPQISLTFTPVYIDGKPGVMEYSYGDAAADQKIFLYPADETLNFLGMTVKDVKVNGKSVSTTVTQATTTNDEYVAPSVPIADVLNVLGNSDAGHIGGTTVTEADREEFNLLSGIEWTVWDGSDAGTEVHYYADYPY